MDLNCLSSLPIYLSLYLLHTGVLDSFCIFVGRDKNMQRSGTEAIRTQIQPSKPKREITKITNSQKKKEHMVNRLSSYFPKDGHSATQTELKII